MKPQPFSINYEKLRLRPQREVWASPLGVSSIIRMGPRQSVERAPAGLSS